MLKIFLIFFLFQLSFLALGQEGVEGAYDSNIDAPDTTEQALNSRIHPLIQIQHLGYQEINYKALNDPRVQRILDKALRDGLIANIPSNTIHKMIMDKVDGTLAEKILNKFPNILNKFIDVLRDKEALPDLLKILSKKQDLKNYFIIWIFILIVSMWLKRRLLSKKAKWNFIQRILVRFCIHSFSLGSSIMAFYFIFEKEMTSTLKLFNIN